MGGPGMAFGGVPMGGMHFGGGPGMAFYVNGVPVGGRRRRYVGPAQRAGDASPGGSLSRPAFDPQPTG
mgnify:CR=1 FL=1